MTFNRYQDFTFNGTMKLVPFIKIPKKNSDIYITYETSKSRLDLISYKIYNDANFGWLILQANPELGSLEFNIPNNTVLRVPYPLETTLIQYNNDVKKYKELYGLN